MIKFFNYSKAYGSHKILSISDMILQPGIHWIKGINGSGKSTLLKSIAGIIPFKGDITIDHLSVKTNPVPYRRLVSYSEAEPIYPDFLTANDLIEFITGARGEEKEVKGQLIQYFGVNHFLFQPTGGYSAGMLKKLSLCTAFLGNPTWILLDEPFAFLDSQAETILIELIMTKSKSGTNFILTSHHDIGHDLLSFNSICSIDNEKMIRIQ